MVLRNIIDKMSQVNIGLNERSPALVEASKYFNDRVKRLRKNTPRDKIEKTVEEDRLLENLCLADLHMDMAIACGSDFSDSMSFMMRYLNKLTDLAQDHNILGVSLNRYLPRLQEFANRDESLQDLYDSYQQAFGGFEK